MASIGADIIKAIDEYGDVGRPIQHCGRYITNGLIWVDMGLVHGNTRSVVEEQICELIRFTTARGKVSELESNLDFDSGEHWVTLSEKIVLYADKEPISVFHGNRLTVFLPKRIAKLLRITEGTVFRTKHGTPYMRTPIGFIRTYAYNGKDLDYVHKLIHAANE